MTERKQGTFKIEIFLKAVAEVTRAKGMIMVLEVEEVSFSLCWLNSFPYICLEFSIFYTSINLFPVKTQFDTLGFLVIFWNDLRNSKGV